MRTATLSFDTCQESLHTTRRQAIELLGATRTTRSDEARFDWLYRENPDGEAVLWTVRDGETGQMAGFTVCLPRRVLVEGQVRVCWNGADFSMDPRFRTLGPAVKLRRAAKTAIDEGAADFLYSHPNERMALIHARVGHQPVGRMLRYAKVLRTRPYLRSRLRNDVAAAVLAKLVDPALRVSGREFWRRPATRVRLTSPARFDKRFDLLFAAAGPALKVVGVRDSRYLNWRYAENPLYESHLLTAEDSGWLRGYLVFTIQDGVGQIRDLFPPGDDEAARDLIQAVIREGRRRGLNSLTFTALERNPLFPMIAEYGFRQRPDSSQMFAYARPDAPWSDVVLDRGSWFLTVGDRDV